ncbi:MAG: methionine--tRNA ligase [Alphaproteobacteria bacterium]|nr:methionine--tRNA ligase [Alphaproteobacteria bacterium]
MKKEKILVTCALPYVNGLPHLGHLAGCLLPSDVYARFNRLVGNEVLYIGGTDEHGTPSELGAKKEGIDVLEYTTKYHNLHKDIYKKFNLSFDYFGRTSAQENTELSQQIARELAKNGYIEEREVEQVFSIDDNMFLPDRYITGTCPYCGATNARGDQCENCTKVLDPKDLIEPRSSVSGSTNLEVRKTKHLYLKLSKLSDKVREWVNTRKWNKLTLGIANKWLDEGLDDRCITRDLKWGIPVPTDVFPDMKDKVFYVWFDAPIGYISITKELLGDGYKNWWLESCGAGDEKYVEFMGKDNVPFHSIMFPATLIGANPDYKKVDTLKGLSYLNFNGGKFSKSAGRGIFADSAIAEFPADYWRYWLIKNAPETDDTDFTFERFAEEINKDLNDVLGNFVLRVLKFYNSKIGSTLQHNPANGEKEIAVKAELKTRIESYTNYLSQMEFRKAMAELRAIWVLGNTYIDEMAPWTVFKTDAEKSGEILAFAMNLMRIFLVLAKPVIPETAEKILTALHTSGDWIFDVEAEMNSITKGHEFEVPSSVFTKITPEKVMELNEKYNAKK